VPRRCATGIALLGCAVFALYGAVAFDRISADSLRANITWLAADERQGRMTPSAGLDASADYLAEQFKQAGLAPGGANGTFFQTAPLTEVRQNPGDFRMTLEAGGRQSGVARSGVSVLAPAGIDYQNQPIIRLPASGPIPEITAQVVTGGEVWAEPDALRILEARKPALILLAMEGSKPREDGSPSVIPVIRIYNRAAASLLTGGDDLKLTLHVASSPRNVAGILPGSDPALRNQFVIVSAHYDHLGMKSPGPGNRIFHGANDNASGDASLIEIAKALAADPHPRRSVLFLALFGEEEGLLGSEYYVRYPLVPLARTVADINLEQLGRTDSSDGPELARFALTGPSYSNLASVMSAAAKTEGVAVYRKDTADDYFNRSDNYSFARAGIVAHTVVVAFEYPDYHAVSDVAEKIDYVNLAKVDRGIAAGVAAIADEAEAPKWSDAGKARLYRDTGH
jgi:Peptidase family M28